jgi:hypothetical protein
MSNCGPHKRLRVGAQEGRGLEEGKKGSRNSDRKRTTLVTMRNLDNSKCGQPFLDVFVRCAQGLGSGKLITRESRQDKEFHFQIMLIRGRKRYVAPTPFALTVGTAHNQTLILPTGWRADSRLREVGLLVRHEPEKLVIGYALDTRANTLVPELVDNPSAGREHSFSAFRLKGAGGEEVAVRPIAECSEDRAWDEPDALDTSSCLSH